MNLFVEVSRVFAVPRPPTMVTGRRVGVPEIFVFSCVYDKNNFIENALENQKFATFGGSLDSFEKKQALV